MPLVALAAALFFKYTKFGVAIRATAENRDAAQLLGISARRVSSFTWVVGRVAGGLAALLIVPAQRLARRSSSLSTALLVRALAAALVGGLTSLARCVRRRHRRRCRRVPHAVADGTRPACPRSCSSCIVIAVLVFRPGGLFGGRSAIEDIVAFVPCDPRPAVEAARASPCRGGRDWHVHRGRHHARRRRSASRPVRSPTASSPRSLVFAIVGVSLTVLDRLRRTDLARALGARRCRCVRRREPLRPRPVPFPLVFPLVVADRDGASRSLIGLPALRIRGPYLAVVTLAFALACSQWIFTSGRRRAAGRPASRSTPPKYGWFNLASETNRPLFFFAFAVFLLCAWVAHNFKRSRTGRGFFSLRENEKAAATFGVELTRYRLLAFMLSGGIAALAGSRAHVRCRDRAASPRSTSRPRCRFSSSRW